MAVDPIIGNDGRAMMPEDPDDEELVKLHNELADLMKRNVEVRARLARTYHRELDPLEVIQARLTLVFDAICPPGTQTRYEFELMWNHYILDQQQGLDARLNLSGAPRFDAPGILRPSTRTTPKGKKK